MNLIEIDIGAREDLVSQNKHIIRYLKKCRVIRCDYLLNRTICAKVFKPQSYKETATEQEFGGIQSISLG